MRQKIISKNLKAPLWKFYKNKSIQIINDGGWHFNSILTPNEISQKLKSFAHQEYAPEYSDEEIIKIFLNLEIYLKETLNTKS